VGGDYRGGRGSVRERGENKREERKRVFAAGRPL
jgi:hypothetical protein